MDFTFVQNSVDDLTMNHGAFMVQIASQMLNAFAVIGLLWEYVAEGFSVSRGVTTFLMKYIVRFFVCSALLNYYYQPIPFLHLGLSFHQLFPAMADFLANVIDDQRMDILFSRIDAVLLNVNNQSTGLNWTMAFVACLVELQMWLYQAIAFISIAMSYMVLGILNPFGPLFILTIMIPKFSHLFWNWMQSVWEYCAFRVAASAAVFVLSDLIVSFLSNTMHGNYSLANWLVMMGKLLPVTLGALILILRLSNVVADMFKGTAQAGSNFIPAAVTAVRLEQIATRG